MTARFFQTPKTRGHRPRLQKTAQTEPVFIKIGLMFDLLNPGWLSEVRIDLTTRCNLRCVYCAVSQFTYQGADMPLELAERAVKWIGDLAEDNIFPSVHINGHGETTFLPKWVEICSSLLRQDIPLLMTTNLAKQFSAEELDVLAQMDTIMVSIDTADPELLRRLRRKVSLAHIEDNIRNIRKAATALRTRAPLFRISCGLYDKNTLAIEGLAQFAIEHNFQGVGFWNLSSWSFDKFPYENTDVPVSDRAYPLDDLQVEELRPRLAAIRNAIELLKSHGIEVHINGDFISSLSERLQPVRKDEPVSRSHDLPKGTTRNCLDPWIYCELNTNGDVQPCCAHSKIGNLHQQNLPEILNADVVRTIRKNLLDGTPDAECANCRLRAPIEPEALNERVRSLLEESDQHVVHQSAFRSARVNQYLKIAFDDLKSGDAAKAWSGVRKALAIDPGIKEDVAENEAAIRECLPRVLQNARFPLTLTWLAGMFRHVHDDRSAILLLERYLQLAPDASDREAVLQGIRDAEWSLGLHPVTALVPDSLWTKARSRIRFRTRVRNQIDRLVK